VQLSVDDGCASDVRVADLAEKYEVKTVFYWPVEWHSLAYDNGYMPLSYDQAFSIAKTHEIGSHTITHRHLTSISETEALKEIGMSKVMLTALFNREIKKFCPPRGYTNESLTEQTMLLYESQRLTKGKELVHIHPNSGANGNKPWRDCITKDTKELWCHSWELDRYNLWDELEDYLRVYSRS
jgi:peptidoglycan/xylan/chitin deacetylase (PgdA/CDA1 family)